MDWLTFTRCLGMKGMPRSWRETTLLLREITLLRSWRLSPGTILQKHRLYCQIEWLCVYGSSQSMKKKDDVTAMTAPQVGNLGKLHMRISIQGFVRIDKFFTIKPEYYLYNRLKVLPRCYSLCHFPLKEWKQHGIKNLIIGVINIELCWIQNTVFMGEELSNCWHLVGDIWPVV